MTNGGCREPKIITISPETDAAAEGAVGQTLPRVVLVEPGFQVLGADPGIRSRDN